MVPVIRGGRRIAVHPDRVKSYDLDAAQSLVDQVRSQLPPNKYDSRGALEDQIEHLGEFVRAAGEVATACRSKINDLETARAELHSDSAAAKHGHAIERLKFITERHVRMQARLYETLRRARQALAEWRDTKPKPPT
jgi:chromosome segregation ATPase